MDNDERLMILKMVQEDKITVDQALELLNALEDEGIETFDADEAIKVQESGDKSESIPGSESPSAAGIGKILSSLFTNGFGNFNFSKTFSIPAQDGVSFTLRGKNGHIELIPSSEQDIRLEIKWYKRKNKPDGIDVFKKDDGEWDMNIAEDVQRATLEAYVPARYYGNIKFLTSNGHIKIICPLDCSTLEAVTSNASIDVSKACCETSLRLTTANSHININDCETSLLWAHTSNAHIDIIGGKYERIELTTSNAHSKLENARAEQAQITTSNGSITVENCEIDDASVKTSNAGISIQDLCPEPNTVQGKLKVITSNGSINISIKNKKERAYAVDAITSHGKATVSLPDISIGSSNQAIANGSGYDTAANKMVIYVRSSNGNVSIE